MSTLWQMSLMALHYLGARKLRTALTTLAIVFGVALIFAINLALPNAIAAFQRSLSGTTGVVDLSVSSTSGQSFAPDAPLQTVAGVEGVAAVTGILHRQLTLPTGGVSGLGTVTQLDILGVDPTTAEQVRPYLISEGRFLQPDDTDKAVVPAAIAALSPELAVGKTFPLLTAQGIRTVTIVGFLAENPNASAPQVILPLRDAQAALDQEGRINTIDVRFVPNADREAVTAAVQAALGDDFAVNAQDNALDAVGSLQIGYAMFNLMGALALFLGAFLIFNTFRAVILERRHDLAMLRALGATRAQVTQMLLIESLLQGIIGTTIGLLLGYALAASLTAVVDSVIDQYLPGLQFTLSVTAYSLVVPIVAGVVTSLVAGYWPARAASRICPLDALRPASIAEVHRSARWGLVAGVVLMAIAFVLLVSSQSTTVLGAILFLVGMVFAAPGLVIPMARLFSPMLSLWFAREGDIARGNLTREPGRAAITASTLMIGLGALIMIFALVNSFDHFIEDMTRAAFSSDIVITPPAIGVYQAVVGADETLGTELRALPDVQTVASLRYASSKANGQAVELLGINPQDYPQVTSLELGDDTPSDAISHLAEGRTLLLTPLAASTFGVKVGDAVTLQTVNGPQLYTVVGFGHDVLSMKVNAAYISQENLATDFNKTEDVLLMVNVTPRADKAAALTEVQQVLQAYPQFTASLASDYAETLLNTSQSALVLFYGIGVLILIPSALGLLNTLTINILERRREIGVLRAVGSSKAQIRRMVTAESLLLGLFGAACGVIVGIAMSYGFIMAFSLIGWSMPYSFPLVGIVASIIIAVLLALFASILPAQNAARLDIIRALQFE